MPEYRAPGVYVEEIEIGGKPIKGVSTSTAGFLGETERGPTVPQLVTNLEQFRRIYGGYAWAASEKAKKSYLPYAVDGFFANGGKRCFVGRIAGNGSVAAQLVIELPGRGRPESNPSKEKSRSRSLAARGEDTTKEATETGAESGTLTDDLLFTIAATGPGSWGNRIAVDIGQASLKARYSELFKLTVSYWTSPSASYDDPATLKEEFDNLSMDDASPDFLEKRINYISNLITVEVDPKGTSQRPKIKPQRSLSRLEGGGDGSVIEVEDYKKWQSSERTGLAAFEKIDEISIVCAPNENDFKQDKANSLTNALVAHCENMMDRFVVLQAPHSAGAVESLLPPTDSKYAAYYYPWLKVLDPATNLPILIPPGGHVVGIYARNDAERGVHKAPANEPVRGALGLQLALTRGEQEILNPRGINCILVFPGHGIRVWGARTTSSDTLWKYVNVRRLFLFLEESIDEGTQWVVFEPNDQRLWARVRQTVTDFLTRVWRNGALMGSTAEEVFFVKCDETTMTDDDIANGRLLVLVGVAPVRPAEFIIFRIAQWRGGSTISE